MHDSCVIAIFENAEDARKAVHDLDDSTFPTKQISLILGNLEDHPDIEKEIKHYEDSADEVMKATGLDSLADIALRTVVMVGDRMLLAVGAMGELVSGNASGPLLAAFFDFGVHDDRARHYESVVNAGHPLVIAHGNPAQVREAFRLLQNVGTRELHCYSTSGDDPSLSIP